MPRKNAPYPFLFLKLWLVLIAILISDSVYPQDFHILQKIDSLQSRGTAFYRKGLFPTRIRFENRRKTHEDNNIFFTALTVYTLQSLRSSFAAEGKTLIDTMEARALRTYPYYKNRQGGPTYNFYQTHPDRPFPGFPALSKKKRFRLADDLDDVSFLYLTQHTPDSLNEAVKHEMEQQTRSPEKVRSTFQRYRRSKAYRTWFAHRMKQDLDICVMSNVLLFVYQKHLPLDSTDYRTIRLISRMVEDNDIMKYGYLVSSHYQQTPVILYHLSRLILVADNPELNELIPKIVADLKSELKVSHNRLEQIILLSSLYRLNQPVDFTFTYGSILKDMPSFYWFRANPFSGSNVFLKRIMGRHGLLNFKYSAQAFYWSLVLELQQLSGAKIQPSGDFYKTNMFRSAESFRAEGLPSQSSRTPRQGKSQAGRAGVYVGRLPCADCSGILAEVRLNPDSTYETAARYLGKGDAVLLAKGRYHWDGSHQKITLLKEDGIQLVPNHFQIKGARLIGLDAEGRPFQGPLPPGTFEFRRISHPDSITGKTWRLILLNGQKIAFYDHLRRIPNLIFMPHNRVSGSDGCNLISGSYRHFSGHRFGFSGLVSTKMACLDAPYQQAFQELLQKADRFSRKGDTLFLKAGKSLSAEFVAIYIR